MMENPLEMAKQVRAAIGYNIPIKPFERVIKVVTGPSTVGILIETFGVTETTREVRFNSRSERMMIFVPVVTASGTRWIAGTDDNGFELVFDMPDEEFVPFRESRFGRVETARETFDRVEFEHDCYRPGGGLESYNVTLGRGAEAPASMKKHWASK